MDIVERLRTNWDFDNDDKLIAADEIERLRDALETFANNVKEVYAGIDKNWAKTVNPLKAKNQFLLNERGKMIDLLEFAADALHDVGSYSAWAAIRIALADFKGQENGNDQI